MNDLVYSIRNTFDKDPRNGVLGKNKASHYFIAPYQRGYKWASFTDNDPVNLLMSDLKDAFSNNSTEYFLQYITICKAANKNETVLEVIDGQQRLTTLTLLLSSLSSQLKSTDKPISNNLLSYEVRPIVTDYFANFIYNFNKDILELTWENFVSKYPNYNEQDIYYLFNALKKINELLPQDIVGFQDYILDNVKLIINTVEKNASSEKIFSNLNTNKVELTSSELIKALLLTKSARERLADQRIVKYKEIVEKRALLGRQWDEIERWANRPEIKSLFFKNSSNSIEELLNLVAIKLGKPISGSKSSTDLFNFFQSLIKKNQKSSKEIFEEVRKIKNVLNEWFIEPNLYNLVGYILLSMDSAHTTSDLINFIDLPKDDLEKELKSMMKALIPINTDDLEYGEDDSEIHRLLLALSVFCSNNRFDFHSFSLGKWSLEHVFPQNPKEFSKSLKKPDIDLINSILKNKMADIKKSQEPAIKSLLSKLLLNECELDDDEVKHLCEILKSEKLNSIGNMALLTSSDNSSNSNGMFIKKRHNITSRISLGSFVPKHTYDVFSKLLSSEMDQNLNVWSEKDIDAHKKWIDSTLKTILG